MWSSLTIDVSSEDDDDVPTDPVFLGKGVVLPPNTGLLTIGGDNALCIFAISEGLKFPLCKSESHEYGLFGGTGKWVKFGLLDESTEIFFNWGGGALGFGGFRSNELAAETVLWTGVGVERGDTDGDGFGERFGLVLS